MIDTLIHWVLSWSLLLYGALALGVAGIVAGWLLKAPASWLLKGAGVVLLIGAVFLAGYQTAEERSELERKLAQEQGKTRDAVFERDTARKQLGNIALTAKAATEERDHLRSIQSTLNKKVGEYETEFLRLEQEANKKGGKSCASGVITDRDIELRRRLHRR